MANFNDKIYVKGTPEDKDDIVDFLNLVFSQSHFPHDFKKISPKTYSEKILGLGAEHYLVKIDGKIKASVVNRIVNIDYFGKILKVGLIGNVAVHPYSRGEGYMKNLMNQAVDEAYSLGVDILLLGGQRQRYSYFGFENGGLRLRFSIYNRNVKHCLFNVDVSNIEFKNLNYGDKEVEFAREIYYKRPVHALRSEEEFMLVLNSGDNICRAVYVDGQMIGYVVGNFEEVVLVDEKYYPAVLKAFFTEFVNGEVFVVVPPCEIERVKFLQDICQDYQLCHFEMINVLNWEKVLNVAFTIKSKMVVLQDGDLTVEIEGQSYRISVKNGEPLVTKVNGEKAIERLNHMDAQRRFFELKCFIDIENAYKNWLPLPFFIDNPDTF